MREGEGMRGEWKEKGKEVKIKSEGRGVTGKRRRREQERECELPDISLCSQDQVLLCIRSMVSDSFLS